MAGTAAIFGRSRDDPAAAKPATPLLTLRWTLSVKRACVVVTDSKPDGFAPLPRQRPWASAGFRWCGAMLRRHKGEEFCMSKRKRGRAAKAQASSTVRPKAARSGEHTNLIATVSNWRSVTPVARWRGVGSGARCRCGRHRSQRFCKREYDHVGTPQPVNRGV
jgi:hypothetical protein